jgi:hypothetical protein
MGSVGYHSPGRSVIDHWRLMSGGPVVRGAKTLK